MEEVGGAIQRVDDPARLAGIAGDLASLFADDAPVGPGILELVKMVCSARLSAIDTKSAGPFFDTCSCSTSL
jgi:hypothetical protein